VQRPGVPRHRGVDPRSPAPSAPRPAGSRLSKIEKVDACISRSHLVQVGRGNPAETTGTTSAAPAPATAKSASHCRERDGRQANRRDKEGARGAFALVPVHGRGALKGVCRFAQNVPAARASRQPDKIQIGTWTSAKSRMTPAAASATRPGPEVPGAGQGDGKRPEETRQLTRRSAGLG